MNYFRALLFFVIAVFGLFGLVQANPQEQQGAQGGQFWGPGWGFGGGWPYGGGWGGCGGGWGGCGTPFWGTGFRRWGWF